MKERFSAQLAELTAIDGVSGFEGPVVRYLQEAFAPLADDTEIDALGNLLVRKGSGEGPVLMLAAHSDEIGCIVKSIEKDGFLRFEKLGGTTDPLLLGRRVRVKGVPGVIGAKAGHLQTEKERTQVTKASELYIDVGARSEAEVREMGINIGDPVAYDSPLRVLGAGNLVSGKALDDRLGCLILLELFRRVKREEIAGTVYAAITVQEEVGLRGATVAAYRLNPHLALAIDTMPAGDTPDVNFYRELPVGIGRGPTFQVMSGGGARGHLLHPAVKSLLTETAEREGIPHQLTTFTGGTTDASAIHLSREGIPTGVIAIPRRYSHSPIEMADLNDALATLRLLEAVVRDLGSGRSLSFI
ncbi:MAG: M42 family metallopeptidase [Firmicutes bacterium]|nr:M42 family metallopeptidase [Bacillota bacterium]MCL5038740.1 M42 family metallopeptidase [Bacillota bacterium]